MFLLFAVFHTIVVEAQNDALLIKKANSEFQLGNYSVAINDYRQLLSKDPKSIDFNFKYATCLYHTDDINKATKFYDLILNMYDPPKESYFYRGKIYQNNYDFQKAINGEPIYCNGEMIYLHYNPEFSAWKRYGPHTFGWDRWGKVANDEEKHDLSTDPPKKKVMVTAYVYMDLMGVLFVSNLNPTVVSLPNQFITEKQFEALQDKIYETLMSNEDFGLGEMGSCRDEAKRIVIEWCKENQINIPLND
jgi:hypothetical protein